MKWRVKYYFKCRGGNMRANGFSLIELMIVIGVITLINIVMVPNFNRLQQSAKLQSAKSGSWFIDCTRTILFYNSTVSRWRKSTD